MSPTELLAALEAADGPSRELDADIAIACGLVPDGSMHMSGLPDPATFATGSYTSWRAPFFTSSIDAALTLVPEGWRIYTADFSIENQTRWLLKGPCKISIRNETGELEAGPDWYAVGVARTPAISLCIAALRARGVG